MFYNCLILSIKINFKIKFPTTNSTTSVFTPAAENFLVSQIVTKPNHAFHLTEVYENVAFVKYKILIIVRFFTRMSQSFIP